MEKISQLMDGELGGQECGVHLRRLTQDANLVQSWSTYHLIRDVLRDEASCGYDLTQRVRQRLEREPTVIAPHTRLPARVLRHTMPIAAAVGGVAVVGWLALGMWTTAAPEPALADGRMKEYLMAHQEYSPTTDIQGFTPYIRTVSNREADAPQ